MGEPLLTSVLRMKEIEMATVDSQHWMTRKRVKPPTGFFTQIPKYLGLIHLGLGFRSLGTQTRIQRAMYTYVRNKKYIAETTNSAFS